jgi:signal transduction histidine kinase
MTGSIDQWVTRLRRAPIVAIGSPAGRPVASAVPMATGGPLIHSRRSLRWLVVVGAFAVTFGFSYGPGSLRMSFPASVVVSAAIAGVIWLSMTKPVVALGVATVMTAVLPAIRSTFDAMALVLVLVGFQAAMRSELSRWVLVPTVFGALTANDIWLRVAFGRTFMEPSLLYPALMCALAVGLGLQSRQLRLHQARLEELHTADRQRAVLEQRRQIARDVHDIAAHHLSALVVRNKLARRVGTIAALDQAAGFSADTAAEALASLRQVVGVLAADEGAPLDPQPSLREIDVVVDRMEQAGLRIQRSPLPDSVPAREVEVAAVRIVQEALANVLRHRGPGRAWVSVGDHDGALEVTVDDDGPGTWQAELGEGSWYRPSSHGLIGMRERAEACGGRLIVGPSPRGGWRVSALLPGTRS